MGELLPQPPAAWDIKYDCRKGIRRVREVVHSATMIHFGEDQICPERESDLPKATQEAGRELG